MAITVTTNNYKAPGAEYPKEVVCQNCQSIIKIGSAADLINVWAKNLTGVQDYVVKGFNCPACGKTNITG